MKIFAVVCFIWLILGSGTLALTIWVGDPAAKRFPKRFQDFITDGILILMWPIVLFLLCAY